MTEKQITELLKGKQLSKNAIYEAGEALTKNAMGLIDKTLDSLVHNGIVGEHDGTYFLLEDAHLVLGKVFLKKQNFIVMHALPSREEIKISGEESQGLLIGDLVYVKRVSGFYHTVDYLKPVDSFIGNFSLTSRGEQQLQVPYLNAIGDTVLIDEVADDIDIHQGDMVKGEILSLNRSTYHVKVTELLVRASDVGSDISMVIRREGAPDLFSKEALEQAKAMEEDPSEEEMKDRTDLRSLPFVTIDGDDAHDFDDAVYVESSLEGYRAYVSIADVTHYMTPNSPLDDDAHLRGTSIYVADRVVPMLPFELSNGICSLNPDKDRLTLTVIMDLDSEGNVFHSEIVKSVIHSHARLTYNQVNAHFRFKDLTPAEQEKTKDVDLPKEILDLLDTLKACGEKIRKRRSRQGALKLSSTELKFKLDENGNPTDVIKNVQDRAEKMIEDFMIIANCEVAKSLKSHHIPVLYRVHEFPKLTKINDFKDFIKKMDYRLIASFPRSKDLSGARLNDFLSQIKDDGEKEVISYMMLRALAKARYTPEELGHFGLAEPYYCHFTSPIRRYPDDIIHRLVKNYLIDKKPFDKDDVYARLEQLGEETSEAEVRADTIERDVDDLESAKYMMKHIGEEYDGKVTGIIAKGMFIETSLGIEGFLSFHCMHGDNFYFDDRTYSVKGRYHEDISFTIGTPIKIKVMSADPDSREIDFATPEFYDKYAATLSPEEREDLSKHGIFIEREGDDRRDFRVHDDKKGFNRSHDRKDSFRHDGDVTKERRDEGSEAEYETITTGTGYTAKVKKAKPEQTFDRKPFDKSKKKRKDEGYSSHKGYSGHKDEDRERRPFRKPYRKSFDRDDDREERKDGYKGRSSYGNRKPGYRNEGKFSRDGNRHSSYGHGRSSYGHSSYGHSSPRGGRDSRRGNGSRPFDRRGKNFRSDKKR